MNIQHEDSCSVVERALEKRINKASSMYFLIELLDIILEHNLFRFGEDFYYQAKVIAIGSPIAPYLLNLFMEEYETTYILNEDSPFKKSIRV